MIAANRPEAADQCVVCVNGAISCLCAVELVDLEVSEDPKIPLQRIDKQLPAKLLKFSHKGGIALDIAKFRNQSWSLGAHSCYRVQSDVINRRARWLL
jgi:hypothetical protein